MHFFKLASPRARAVGLTALVLFSLYSIAGFLVLPPYARRLAVERLSEQLGRQVSIGSVNLNPYTLVAVVRGLEIKEADGSATFLSFGSLTVDLQISSLFRKGPVIREVRLERPYVHLVREDANAYNFSDIVERLGSRREAGPPEGPGKPLLFSVSNIQIAGGDIEFNDRPAATKHRIAQIVLSIPFISNLPSYVESFVQPSLSALVNGTPLKLQGDSKVFADSRETVLDIELKDISIPHYLAYAPAKLNIRVPSGLLDVMMKVTYREYTNRSPLLVLTGESRVRELRAALRSAREDFLRIPLLSIRNVSLDLEEKFIRIGAFATERGSLAIVRSAEGQVNVASISTGAPAAGPAAPAAESTDASSWSILLDSLRIDDYAVTASDLSPEEPFRVTVDRIGCKVDGLSTRKDAKAAVDLSMRVAQKGTASLLGELVLNPPVADFTIDIRDVPLRPLQPLLAERMQAILASGALLLRGRLSLRGGGAEGMQTSFAGALQVNRLSLLDANEEDLLKWDTFSFGGIDIRYGPSLFAHVREVALSRFYSRIIVSEDRKLNLQEVFSAATATPEKADAAKTEPPANESAKGGAAPMARPPTVRIDKVTLQGGTINFTDNSITPPFHSNLLEIGGRVSGLSSDADTMGEVELRGMYDRYAPLVITGKVNPLRDDLYVELHADFKDMDLTSVSPYAGRYAGYTVRKGKLSFHLEYLVRKNTLDATNSVFLDQFTFGDRVDSPEATRLPVTLAVALLKDRNGEIKLDIPVSGELNDPQFSIGGVVLKVIVNLLVKAATSPFALLGALFGGGERIDHVEFEYGLADLDDGAKKKLDILAKALSERPALRMDLVGHADPERDREGLKHAIMLRKVKTQKTREAARTGGATPDPGQVAVTPQEYPEYLRRAYRAERFPKPRNFIGMARELPVPEMEKLILANVPVTDEDLQALAGERVRAVRDRLLQSKQLEPERIFIVEAETLAAEKKEGVRNSRVDFKLK